MSHPSTSLLALVFLSAFTWPSSPARAQLGESEAAILHRFGQPTARETETSVEKSLTFEKPGVMTVVDLREGKCVGIAITKILGDFSPAELQQFLHDNGDGKTWKHDKNDADAWYRSDGIVAYATVGFVSIVTPVEEKRSTGAEIAEPGLPKPGK